MTSLEQIRQLALAGISLLDVEATLRRKLTEDERGEYRRAATVRRLKIAKERQEQARARRDAAKKAAEENLAAQLAGTDPLWAEKLGPASDLERQRKRRARLYEIGPLPPIAEPERRESCREDLLKFILTYCRDLLEYEPSPKIIAGLIIPIQNAVLYGGKELTVFPRATGKTTIIKCAIRWAFAYGHKRFIVIISATTSAAKAIFDECVAALGGLDAETFAADFPALALPIAALNDNKKAAAQQTVNGIKTRMAFASTRFDLPSVQTKDGAFAEPSHGAVLVACSMGGAIKGLVKRSERPDMFFLDDPQTEAVARSHGQTAEAEKFIVGSVLGLSGHTREKTALMAITPIRPGDLAGRFMDRHRYGDWHLTTSPFCTGWTKDHDELLTLYELVYIKDVEIGDNLHKLSREWYEAHRHLFEGVEVISPSAHSAAEVDAIHHLLNLRVEFKDCFDAEYQLDVTSQSTGEPLKLEEVMDAVNGFERNTLPPGTFKTVAFCDVNVTKDAGLRWGLMAFGPNRTAAVVNYGRYPAAGKRLYPRGADAATREHALIEGVKAVTRYLLTDLPKTAVEGSPVQPSAIAFDGGFEMATVDKALKYIGQNWKLRGTHLYWTRGFSWSHYRDDAPGVMLVKDHIHSAVSVAKDRATKHSFLAVHADYWREIAQAAYRIPYPERGSLSLFRVDKEAQRHLLWAEESTAEILVRTYRDERRYIKAWEWDNTRPGRNHSLDIAYNCLALGHWEGLYSALSSPNSPLPSSSTPQLPHSSSPQLPHSSTPQLPHSLKRRKASVFAKFGGRSGGGRRA
jgi:hypothetical protein